MLLGNAAAQHPQAGALLALAQLDRRADRRQRRLSRRSGQHRRRAAGRRAAAAHGGLNAGQMLSQPLKALLLLNVEPVLDAADPAAARAALEGRAWSSR